MTSILESGQNTTLNQKVNAGDANTTILLSSVPWSITAGVCLVGSGSSKEWFSFTGVSSTTLTGVTMGLDKDATLVSDSTTANKKTHRVGEAVRLVFHSLDINQKASLNKSNVHTAGTNTHTSTTVTANVQQNVTTTQRDLLSGVAGGAEIYNTTTNQTQRYEGGAWVATSGTTPDGSTTVAGKYEEATVAEQGSATATGGTGARLIPANANLVKTSAGAGDENKLALLNASGQFDSSFIGNAPDLQEYTSSDTWTKPSGATAVMVICVGGGGGGAGGEGQAAGNERFAGSGGGGGARIEKTFQASDLSATESVGVGAGGTSGAGGTGGDGSAGGAGGVSSFGSSVQAHGGGGGKTGAGGVTSSGGGGGGTFGVGQLGQLGANSAGGTPSAGTSLVASAGAGAAGQNSNSGGVAEYGGGGGGGIAGTTGKTGGSSIFGGGGGGGGGSVASGNTAYAGAAGGKTFSYTAAGGGAGGAATGVAGTAGTAGTSKLSGYGGGGGGGSDSTTGGAGGVGGVAGGGAGGGGGGTNVGGAGGVGGAGRVWVISW